MVILYDIIVFVMLLNTVLPTRIDEGQPTVAVLPSATVGHRSETSMSDWDDFVSYISKYDKKYGYMEIFDRYNIFRDNIKKIEQHNSGNYTFKLNVNEFTDLTVEEFKKQYNLGYGNNQIFGGCKTFINDTVYNTEYYDWRDYGAVSSVKNQGQCGSCWAFSATASVESLYYINNKKLLNLSEQELVDCIGLRNGCNGCNGGEITGAFDYISNSGICSYDNYPYTSGTTKKTGKCVKCEDIYKIQGCYNVIEGNQIQLKTAVLQNPVSVAIEADTHYFQLYSEGIISDIKCGTNLDHAVVVVGFGEENNIKYWIVKNSWGEDWGENGYVRIQRSDSTGDNGICGIATTPSLPY
jgi:C1A family cysteine protease